MRILKPSDVLDDKVELDFDPRPRSVNASAPRPKRKNDHIVRDEILAYAGLEVADLGTEGVFKPSFTGSRHERMWIFSYLGHFYDDKQITDVLGRVKGGKEANVYCCAAHPATGLTLIAAKVYRPRQFRNLRNDSRYRQGRELKDARGKTIRDGGMLNAVAKKTTVGQQAAHVSWVAYEYETLVDLWQAGADVPQPISHDNSTILMEYLGELEAPAPALHAVRLEPDEVQPLFERLLRNVELMLSRGRVHGDLSAYNVLYWEGEIKLIDFPQVVAAGSNQEAFDIFQRDVLRICQYFNRYGLRADAYQIAANVWARSGPPAETRLPAYDPETGEFNDDVGASD